MDVNHLLALIRQELEAVLKLTPLEGLELSSLPKSRAEVIKQKLVRVDLAAEKVNKKLHGEVAQSEIPLFSGSGALLTYFEQEYAPREQLIRNIAVFGDAKGVNFDELLDELGLSSQEIGKSPRECTPIQDALELAIERLEDFLSLDPPEDLTDMADEELIDLQYIVSASFFRPDEWYENMKELRPVASKRRSEMLPNHVRVRIKEIFRSFTFGNWQSVAAMSRGVLEYALIDRAGALGYEAYEQDQFGKLRPVSLRQLVHRASDLLPSVVEDMEAIREYGNEVMHPEKTKKIGALPLSRKQALDCINRVKRSLGAVYA